MTYARARLLVGITAVGTIVALALAALVTGLPRQLLGHSPGTPGRELLALGLMLAVQIAVLAPFDLLGGHLLPRRFGRADTTLAAYLGRWARGVAVQAALGLGSGAALLAAGRWGGLAAAAAVFLLLMVFLLAAQSAIARLLAPLVPGRRGPRSMRIQADDPGFTGGIVGLPGRERLLVPERWDELLGADGVAAQLTRWRSALASGGRLLGVLVALGWNLLGFLLAAQVPGAGVSSAAGLITLVLAYNLWCFGGLLLLPSLSRRGVFAADRLAAEKVADADLLRQTMTRLDRLQDDEPERGAAVESVFHPIPALSRRLARLAAARGPRLGPWHTARTALYLSSAGVGLLSRAVHCNAGRPELWALLPCD